MLKVKERVRLLVQKTRYTERVSDSDGEDQPHTRIGPRTSEIRQNARKKTSEAKLSFAESSADEESSPVRETSHQVVGRAKQGFQSLPQQFSNLAHDRLRRGGHVFDSKACSENRETFIGYAWTLRDDGQNKSLSLDDVLSYLRMATFAVNLGAEFLSGDQECLREFSSQCLALQTKYTSNKDVAALAASLSGWSTSLANDLDELGTARTTVQVGPFPQYESRDGALELKEVTPSIKKRRIEVLRGAVFKVQNLKDASAADLVALLQAPREDIGPKYGPRQQLRLCAHVMRHRRDLGPQERLQVLAHAVVAMREQPNLSLEDQGKAMALFKQVRRSLADGGFGDNTEHAAAWLYEFGQRVVNYGNEGGKLRALS
jgi:hypothetical protein